MHITDLSGRGVRVVGEIPTGFPLPALPIAPISVMGDLLKLAVGAFILACLDAMSVARMFARQNSYRVDTNQELLALGCASLGSAFTQGYPVDGSFSRSALNNECGAKTQLANGISGAMLALVVVFFAGLFSKLPEPDFGSGSADSRPGPVQSFCASADCIGSDRLNSGQLWQQWPVS